MTKNNCAAVNPDGTLETERDTINRLVKNRDELVQHLQSQKEEIENWERQYAALLERKRRLEQYVPADQIAVLHETGGSPDLINIVESQERTIKTYEEVQQGWLDSHARNFKQIESLKAITELAVKGLERVMSGGFEYPQTRNGFIEDTLSEIAKLSHE